MLDCDVLVIGGGTAGVRAALAALQAGASVTLMSKGPVARSGATPIAGGGFQSSMPEYDPRNNRDQHYADIILQGQGINEPALARTLADNAHDRLMEADEFGARFERVDDGSYMVLHDPGQTHPRTLYTVTMRGFLTGMLKRCREYPNFTLLEDVFALELVKDGDQVVGTLAWDLANGRALSVCSRATILATGGYQEVFPLASSSVDTTGDGHLLALKARAVVYDPEMVQFYPTAITWPISARRLLVGYEYTCNPDYIDGPLVDENGAVVMPAGSPPPVRDVASRMILRSLRAGHKVMLDLNRSTLPVEERRNRLRKYYTNPYQHLLSLGLDVAVDTVEVAPGAHYVLGGVCIDARCRTGVPGLYAAGEVTAGVHGANRISGNALTECLAFGTVAGAVAASEVRGSKQASERLFGTERADQMISTLLERPLEEGIRPHDLKRRLHDITSASLVGDREEARLARGLEQLDDLSSIPAACQHKGLKYNKELLNALEWEGLLTCARLATMGATMRKESRGNHQREDYPQADDTNWRKHTAFRFSEGTITAGTALVGREDNADA